MESIVLDLLKKQGERLQSIESLLTLTKTVLNLDEVCKLTGLSKSHIYKRSMLGTIPHFKQAKHLFFDREQIQSWLKEKPSRTADEIERQAATYVTLNPKGGRR